MKKIGKIALSVAVATFFVACGSSDKGSTKSFEPTKNLNNQKISAEGNKGFKFELMLLEDGSYKMLPAMGIVPEKWSIANDTDINLGYKKDGQIKQMPLKFSDVDKNGELNEGDKLEAHGQILTITSIQKVSINTGLKDEDLAGKKITLNEEHLVFELKKDKTFRLLPYKLTGKWEIKPNSKVVVLSYDDASKGKRQIEFKGEVKVGDQAEFTGGMGEGAYPILKIENL